MRYLTFYSFRPNLLPLGLLCGRYRSFGGSERPAAASHF